MKIQECGRFGNFNLQISILKRFSNKTFLNLLSQGKQSSKWSFIYCLYKKRMASHINLKMPSDTNVFIKAILQVRASNIENNISRQLEETRKPIVIMKINFSKYSSFFTGHFFSFFQILASHKTDL